jgi:phosphoesterase RecJ-like protein
MTSLVEQYRAAGSLINQWSRVLLLTHERPDGDALGCLIGLTRMLQAAGKDVTAVCFGAPGPRYAKLVASVELTIQPEDSFEVDTNRLDGVVIVDTCALSQLTPAADFLKSRAVPIVAIDHHVTRDDPASGHGLIADCAVIDPSASASSLQVLELAETMGWPIDLDSATALFTGIATDTGWFRFSNTDARTLRAAARLIECGVQPNELYQTYYMSDTSARSRLLGAALSQLELHADDRVAVLCISSDVLERCGATRADSEDLINEPMRIGTVEASVLLSSLDAGVTKVSLRSKRFVNCASLAAEFGGGGHERAAGVRIKSDLQSVKELILKAVMKQLPSTDATGGST